MDVALILDDRRGNVKKKSGSDVIRKNTQPRIQNPYQERERVKHPDGTACPECGAVFAKGKWTWSKPPVGGQVSPELCPACLQIKADYAGGILTLSGSFLAAHREDILNRVRNVESSEKKDHPLQRIMKIVDKGEQIEIRATSEHLMARMGKALKSDFNGELELSYIEDENIARAHWRRDS